MEDLGQRKKMPKIMIHPKKENSVNIVRLKKPKIIDKDDTKFRQKEEKNMYSENKTVEKTSLLTGKMDLINSKRSNESNNSSPKMKRIKSVKSIDSVKSLKSINERKTLNSTPNKNEEEISSMSAEKAKKFNIMKLYDDNVNLKLHESINSKKMAEGGGKYKNGKLAELNLLPYSSIDISQYFTRRLASLREAENIEKEKIFKRKKMLDYDSQNTLINNRMIVYKSGSLIYDVNKEKEQKIEVSSRSRCLDYVKQRFEGFNSVNQDFESKQIEVKAKNERSSSILLSPYSVNKQNHSQSVKRVTFREKEKEEELQSVKTASRVKICGINEAGKNFLKVSMEKQDYSFLDTNFYLLNLPEGKRNIAAQAMNMNK